MAVIVLIVLIGSYLVWHADIYRVNSKPLAESTKEPAFYCGTVSQTNNNNAPAGWKEGKELFKSNCASCHNPKVNQTGPALMGVEKRWDVAGDFKNKPAAQWLKAWIRNNNDVLKAGYPYAVGLKQKWQSEMNIFPQLKDEDIDKILLFVQNPDMAATPRPVATK